MADIETKVIDVTTANKTPNWKSNDAYVYIGRTMLQQGLYDTGLGNPFIIGKPHPLTDLPMTREEVVELHEEWAVREVMTNYTFRQRLYHLHGKILVCWCIGPKTPNAKCHGLTYKRLSESIYHHQNEMSKVWSSQPTLIGYREAMEKEQELHREHQEKLYQMNKALQESATHITGYESMKEWHTNHWKPFMKEVNTEIH